MLEIEINLSVLYPKTNYYITEHSGCFSFAFIIGVYRVYLLGLSLLNSRCVMFT